MQQMQLSDQRPPAVDMEMNYRITNTSEGERQEAMKVEEEQPCSKRTDTSTGDGHKNSVFLDLDDMS